MGLLSLAGVLSGAGEAGTKALAAGQAGMIQSELQAERDKMENARFQLHEQYAGEREQRGYAHAEAMATNAQSSQAAEGKANRATQEKIAGENLQFHEGKQVDDNTLENKKLDQAKDLKGQELSILERSEASKSKYYEALADYNKRSSKGPGATKDLSETTKAALGFYNSRIVALEKQANDPLTPPDTAAKIHAQIDDLSKKGLALLGITDQAAEAGAEIDDPFSGSVTPGKKGQPDATPSKAAEAPKARGERVLPNATPPPNVSATEALAGGARAATGGLLDMAMPYGQQPTNPGVTIERRPQGVR